MPMPAPQSPMPLWSVRDQTTASTADDRREIATQLRRALRDYYVHLPQKTASMAIDPLRELELLADDAEEYRDSRHFFHRLLGIFTRLRDRHTTVRLPPPWSAMIAFLPFVAESCFEDGRRKLILSKLLDPPHDPRFMLGVEITHWNGTPVRQFIEGYSWDTPGANPWARVALALRSLTMRPMAFALPPDEDWVTLTYIDHTGDLQNITYQWLVMGAPPMMPSAGPQGGGAPLLGVDEGTDTINSGLKLLYSAQRPKRLNARSSDDIRIAPLRPEGRIPPGLLASKLETSHGKIFGVLRIFSFHTDNLEQYPKDMARLLRQMPRDGLILDVRANPGGTIPAGEILLQLLTPDPIACSPNEFRATPATRQLSHGAESFERWSRSLDLVLETGQAFSQGYPLWSRDLCAGLEGSYRGPAVVIMDALSYSTTDYFVGGFVDNNLGTVIGADPTTGAGGANVWSLGQITQFAEMGGGSAPFALPAGVEANIAVRRGLGVGANFGLPYEGLGAKADMYHAYSRADLLRGNSDLLRRAAAVLAGM